MATPRFQVDGLLQQHNVAVFSSNYALYADISDRVMTTLESLAPNVEVYSIDEAFLDLDGFAFVDSLSDYGRRIRHTVQRDTGIAVGVGIAPTKTLAKLANHAAKKYPATGGVVDLSEASRQRKLLMISDVGDVWGVGRKIKTRLNQIGINSALDLACADLQMIRKRFNVVLEQTVRELNGESCLALETISPPKKQIVCSRSFGRRVTEKASMRSAVSSHAVRAAEKLRSERQKCQYLRVFIRTSPFAQGRPQYANSRGLQLPFATQDSRLINHYAQHLLDSIWASGFEYAKAGVMLAEFSPRDVGQDDIFGDQDDAKRRQLMETLDRINQRTGGKLKLGSEGLETGWKMARHHLSPAYTTRWDQLPKVR